MPIVRINGSLAAIRQGVDVFFDTTRGLRTRERYLSAGDNLAGFAGALYTSGVDFVLHRSPVMSSIEVNFSGGAAGMPDDVRTNWQLLANEAQESIYKNPFVQDAFNTYPNLRNQIQRWQQLWDSGDTNAADSLAADPPESAPSMSAIINMIKNGETHFNVSQYVLKRSLSISNFFTESLPDESNAGKLILAGSFTGLPGPIQAKIDTIPAPSVTAPYYWSWRQLPSTMTTTAHNRTDVSTEWWLAAWNNNLYAFA